MMLLVTFQVIEMGIDFVTFNLWKSYQTQNMHEKEKASFEVIDYKYINYFLIVKQRYGLEQEKTVSVFFDQFIFSWLFSSICSFSPAIRAMYGSHTKFRKHRNEG